MDLRSCRIITRNTPKLELQAQGDPDLVAALVEWLEKHDPLDPKGFILRLEGGAPQTFSWTETKHFAPSPKRKRKG